MNMIKRTLQMTCVSLFILASIVLHSAEVGENEILAASKKWIADNAVFQAEQPDAVPEKAMQMTDAEGRRMPLWLVELQPTGYLIMSADDTLPPVVAFDANGPFDMPAAHPLPAMLNRQGVIFQEELDKPKTRGNKLAVENQSRWNVLLGRTRADAVTPSTIVVQPFVMTEWDQTAPYDFLCPSNKTYTSRAVTGCVPLAIAQLLKYYEWPAVGNGTKSFTDKAGEIRASLSVDYAFPYDWSSMADSYSPWGDEQDYGAAEMAVARLAMEMGVLAEADYEIDGTAAYVHQIHTFLSQFLRYSNTAVYGDSRSGYIGYVGQTTLYSRIRADMMAHRPALLSYAGHTFIADGLGSMGDQEYYHFNYGWGGYQTGWYLLTDGYESTVIIGATTNIQPSPMPVFKPMSAEQPSSFTLAWDFPKHLSAEAFRLKKTTGARASSVISDSIEGTARSYGLTDQSGTATYTLEAKVNGSWQAASDGVTVTVKTNPATLTELYVDEEFECMTGGAASFNVTASAVLTTLNVTSSRPDILPAKGVSVTGSGATRTVELKLSDGNVGNVLLYLAAVDAVGNTVRKTALLRVVPYIADKTLVSVRIEGEASIASASTESYVCKAAWSDGTVTTVTPSWSLSSTQYASVDATGRVMNLNTTETDQAVTLTANYTVDDVTKTASKAITLARRRLASISVAGEDEIPSGSTETYVCTAAWSDGAVTVVSPTWSLSSTQYASVDIGGKVTNRNTTETEQTVTLTASYTSNGVTKTDSKTVMLTNRSLISLSIAGEDAIPSGSTETYSCTAIWSDGTTTVVSPTWSLSSAQYASVDTGGKVTNRNTAETEQTVTLIASYTSNGVTKTDSKTIMLTNRSLVSLSIVGKDAIPSGGTETYVCKATWSDGSVSTITPTWSLSSSQFASFDADGRMTNLNTTENDQTVTLVANYTVADETKTTTKTITLTKRTLASISITGDGVVPGGATATYVCTATWSDGGTSSVIPAWSLSSSQYATVDVNGKLANLNSSDDDQTVTLTASYAFGGVTKTVVKSITLSKRILVSISITGDSAIPSGGAFAYVCTATWSDGANTAVTPAWQLSSMAHASVDETGKVTNRNTTMTEQTVTLTASYTFAYVTKTASRTIALAKRTLDSISIVGDDTISSGETTTFICMAMWSDGATTAVLPSWSLSSMQYASVDAGGKVTNKNTSMTVQTVTLTADYAADGVAKTISKSITLSRRTLTGVVVNGKSSIGVGATVAYSCTATWSDGATSIVTPSWSLSSTEHAAVDAVGRVTNKNTTETEQTVELRADYTSDGVTKTASKSITLERRTLQDVAVSGPETIPNGGSATYVCMASWSYGEPAMVTPIWSVSSAEYAAVDETGRVVNRNTTETDQMVELAASYTAGGVTKTTAIVITLAKRTLVSISITGDSVIPNGGAAAYICMATWSDGTTTAITPKWSLSSSQYASIDAAGMMTNRNMTEEDASVTLTASYAVGGVTKNMTMVITLKGMPQPTETLDLLPGWNLVTLTRQLKNKTTGVQKFLSLRPLTFDVESRSFVVCDSADGVKAGGGYWVFSGCRQLVELVQDSEQPIPQTELKKGWNLVGMMEDSDWPSSAMAIWTWWNGRFLHIDKKYLRTGRAYWVYQP